MNKRLHDGISSAPQRGRFDPVVVVGIALLVRMLHVHQVSVLPFVSSPMGDAAGYLSWAERIASGEWVGHESFYQAPLYPYVLAAIAKLFGGGSEPVLWVQASWGAVGAGLLTVAASVMGGRTVGLLAGLGLALYPPAIFFDGIVQKASLGLCMMCALLWLICLKGERRFSSWRTLFAGMVSGLLCLTRENAIIWLPIVLAWVVAASRGDPVRRRVQMAGAYCAGLAFTLAPVAAHNRAAGGSWSISTFQAGPNFYIGNSLDADGRYRPIVRGHETPMFERADATRIAQQSSGRELTPAEVSRFWLRRAWDDIKAAPRRWVRLLGLKLWMVWNRYEVSDVEGFSVYRAHSTPLEALSRVWHFGVLAPLAAAGMFLGALPDAYRKLLLILLLSMTAAVAVFYVLARYRLPLVPLLMPLAAAIVTEMARRIQARRWRGLAPAGVAILVTGVAANWPVHDERRLDAMSLSNLGVAYGVQGNFRAAEDALRRALTIFPESAEAKVNLGLALSEQGKDEQAIECFERALALYPELMHAEFLLGRSLERLGFTDRARTHYERALRADPDHAEARKALARLADADQ